MLHSTVTRSSTHYGSPPPQSPVAAALVEAALVSCLVKAHRSAVEVVAYRHWLAVALAAAAVCLVPAATSLAVAAAVPQALAEVPEALAEVPQALAEPRPGRAPSEQPSPQFLEMAPSAAHLLGMRAAAPLVEIPMA